MKTKPRQKTIRRKLTLEYKGYRAVAQFDDQHGQYAAHIQALNKVDVAFFGHNKKDLMKNFEGMVNYYEQMKDQFSLFPKADNGDAAEMN